jgi:hypothetical protein
MSISTYLRPNIHQNGPEILGVNCGNFYILHFNSFCFKNILYIEDAPKHVPAPKHQRKIIYAKQCILFVSNVYN